MGDDRRKRPWSSPLRPESYSREPAWGGEGRGRGRGPPWPKRGRLEGRGSWGRGGRPTFDPWQEQRGLPPRQDYRSDPWLGRPDPRPIGPRRNASPGFDDLPRASREDDLLAPHRGKPPWLAPHGPYTSTLRPAIEGVPGFSSPVHDRGGLSARRGPADYPPPPEAYWDRGEDAFRRERPRDLPDLRDPRDSRDARAGFRDFREPRGFDVHDFPPRTRTGSPGPNRRSIPPPPRRNLPARSQDVAFQPDRNDPYSNLPSSLPGSFDSLPTRYSLPRHEETQRSRDDTSRSSTGVFSPFRGARRSRSPREGRSNRADKPSSRERSSRSSRSPPRRLSRSPKRRSKSPKHRSVSLSRRPRSPAKTLKSPSTASESAKAGQSEKSVDGTQRRSSKASAKAPQASSGAPKKASDKAAKSEKSSASLDLSKVKTSKSSKDNGSGPELPARIQVQDLDGKSSPRTQAKSDIKHPESLQPKDDTQTGTTTKQQNSARTLAPGKAAPLQDDPQHNVIPLVHSLSKAEGPEQAVGGAEKPVEPVKTDGKGAELGTQRAISGERKPADLPAALLKLSSLSQPTNPRLSTESEAAVDTNTAAKRSEEKSSEAAQEETQAADPLEASRLEVDVQAPELSRETPPKTSLTALPILEVPSTRKSEVDVGTMKDSQVAKKGSGDLPTKSSSDQKPQRKRLGWGQGLARLQPREARLSGESEEHKPVGSNTPMAITDRLQSQSVTMPIHSQTPAQSKSAAVVPSPEGAPGKVPDSQQPYPQPHRSEDVQRQAEKLVSDPQDQILGETDGGKASSRNKAVPNQADESAIAPKAALIKPTFLQTAEKVVSQGTEAIGEQIAIPSALPQSSEGPGAITKAGESSSKANEVEKQHQPDPVSPARLAGDIVSTPLSPFASPNSQRTSPAVVAASPDKVLPVTLEREKKTGSYIQTSGDRIPSGTVSAVAKSPKSQKDTAIQMQTKEGSTKPLRKKSIEKKDDEIGSQPKGVSGKRKVSGKGETKPRPSPAKSKPQASSVKDKDPGSVKAPAKPIGPIKRLPESDEQPQEAIRSKPVTKVAKATKAQVKSPKPGKKKASAAVSESADESARAVKPAKKQKVSDGSAASLLLGKSRVDEADLGNDAVVLAVPTSSKDLSAHPTNIPNIASQSVVLDSKQEPKVIQPVKISTTPVRSNSADNDLSAGRQKSSVDSLKNVDTRNDDTSAAAVTVVNNSGQRPDEGKGVVTSTGNSSLEEQLKQKLDKIHQAKEAIAQARSRLAELQERQTALLSGNAPEPEDEVRHQLGSSELTLADSGKNEGAALNGTRQDELAIAASEEEDASSDVSCSSSDTDIKAELYMDRQEHDDHVREIILGNRRLVDAEQQQLQGFGLVAPRQVREIDDFPIYHRTTIQISQHQKEMQELVWLRKEEIREKEIEISCHYRELFEQYKLYHQEHVLGKMTILDEHVREKLFDLRVWPPVCPSREHHTPQESIFFWHQVHAGALKALQTTALCLDIPDQIVDARERSAGVFLSENGLIEDPVEELEREAESRPWSEEEKRIFNEKCVLHYKDFAKIASYLEHRTVQDCVKHFFAVRKTDEFAPMHRKLTSRKRSKPKFDASSRQKTFMGMPVAKKQPVRSSLLGFDSRYSRDFDGADMGLSLGRSGRQASRLPGRLRGFPSGPSSMVMEGANGSADDLQNLQADLNPRTEQTHEANNPWSKDEEAQFVDGLRLHGKSFKEVSRHMGERRTQGACKAFYNKHNDRLGLDRVISDRQRQLQRQEEQDDRSFMGGLEEVQEVCAEPRQSSVTPPVQHTSSAAGFDPPGEKMPEEVQARENEDMARGRDREDAGTQTQDPSVSHAPQDLNHPDPALLFPHAFMQGMQSMGGGVLPRGMQFPDGMFGGMPNSAGMAPQGGPLQMDLSAGGAMVTPAQMQFFLQWGMMQQNPGMLQQWLQAQMASSVNFGMDMSPHFYQMLASGMAGGALPFASAMGAFPGAMVPPLVPPEYSQAAGNFQMAAAAAAAGAAQYPLAGFGQIPPMFMGMHGAMPAGLQGPDVSQEAGRFMDPANASEPVVQAQEAREVPSSTPPAQPEQAVMDPQQAENEGRGSDDLAVTPLPVEDSSTVPMSEDTAVTEASKESSRRVQCMWTADEKESFMECFKVHGRDWKRLCAAVPNKTETQVKNYFQNYKTKLGFDKMELPPSAIQPGQRRRREPKPDSKTLDAKSEPKPTERLGLQDAKQPAKLPASTTRETAASKEGEQLEDKQVPSEYSSLPEMAPKGPTQDIQGEGRGTSASRNQGYTIPAAQWRGQPQKEQEKREALDTALQESLALPPPDKSAVVQNILQVIRQNTSGGAIPDSNLAYLLTRESGSHRRTAAEDSNQILLQLSNPARGNAQADPSQPEEAQPQADSQGLSSLLGRDETPQSGRSGSTAAKSTSNAAKAKRSEPQTVGDPVRYPTFPVFKPQATEPMPVSASQHPPNVVSQKEAAATSGKAAAADDGSGIKLGASPLTDLVQQRIDRPFSASDVEQADKLASSRGGLRGELRQETDKGQSNIGPQALSTTAALNLLSTPQQPQEPSASFTAGLLAQIQARTSRTQSVPGVPVSRGPEVLQTDMHKHDSSGHINPPKRDSASGESFRDGTDIAEQAGKPKDSNPAQPVRQNTVSTEDTLGDEVAADDRTVAASDQPVSNKAVSHGQPPGGPIAVQSLQDEILPRSTREEKTSEQGDIALPPSSVETQPHL